MTIRSSQRLTLIPILLIAAMVVASGCSGGGSDSGASLPTAPEPAGGGAAGGSGSTGGGTGGGGTTDPGPAASAGKLTLLLTDNPVDEISQLWVHIEEIKVKPDQQPVMRFPSSLGLVDLLTLQDGVTELLGQGEVDAGIYQFIELLLDEDQSYVVLADDLEETPVPLKIPSEKIKVAGGPFEVKADFTTLVTVDFDAEKSLKKTGNGRYQLKAHVTIAVVSQAAGT